MFLFKKCVADLRDFPNHKLGSALASGKSPRFLQSLNFCLDSNVTKSESQ